MADNDEELVPVHVPRSRLTQVYALLAQAAEAAPAQVAAADATDEPGDWSAEDFRRLLGDSHLSTQRVIPMLDLLAQSPETGLALSEVATATGLSRNELQGALSGFTRVCRSLWPAADTNGIWPMRLVSAQAKESGLAAESFYSMNRATAANWLSARKTSPKAPAKGKR